MGAATSDQPDSVRRSLFGRLLALAIATRIRAGLATGAERSPILTVTQRNTLGACADLLVPGAAAGGVVEFVVTMLGRPDPWLCYRFISLPIPIVEFYRSALDEIDHYCHRQFRSSVGGLSPQAQSEFVAGLARAELPSWRGPPQSLVYFALRSDAVDAVYGTVSAYQQLGVPYMAHIAPPPGWPSV
jgi:Gluconate 2-dehydrogenase subunit 3